MNTPNGFRSITQFCVAGRGPKPRYVQKAAEGHMRRLWEFGLALQGSSCRLVLEVQEYPRGWWMVADVVAKPYVVTELVCEADQWSHAERQDFLNQRMAKLVFALSPRWQSQ